MAKPNQFTRAYQAGVFQSWQVREQGRSLVMVQELQHRRHSITWMQCLCVEFSVHSYTDVRGLVQQKLECRDSSKGTQAPTALAAACKSAHT